MNNDRVFWAGVGLIAVALILASRPNCNRGCRTVAEHLMEHGISDVMASLFV
jgi:hypothetical protein